MNNIITNLGEFSELYGTKYNQNFDLGYFKVENSIVLLNDEDFNTLAGRILANKTVEFIQSLTGFIIAKKGNLGHNVAAEFLVLRMSSILV